ncbi:LCP family protein [Evtepia sp.]|uniref:LCP family protein n=1 Tax=Evtepia sp. TaxID=2773933 RepID=UPI00399B44BE
MAQKKKRKLKKKYRVLRGIYAAIVAIAAVIVIGYGVYKVAVPAPAQAPVASTTDQTQEQVPGMETGDHTRREQTYTFLLTCPDQVSGNADAIMLVTYDVPNQKVGMLSIPRDTLVDQSTPKINFSLHGGIENLQSVVSDLVGYPIDFYINIDLDGFVELVDAVGGVDFNVPIDMEYEDFTQDLYISFEAGMQHLDGQAAMEVCRFRKNNDGTGYPLGDIQRSETVRNLMVTVAKKLVSNIGKLDQFVDILQRNVETSLSGTDLTWFVTKAIGINLDTGVQGNALPGDGNTTYNGTSYCYELDPAGSLAMINQLVNPFTTDLKPEDVNIFQVNDANGRGYQATASDFVVEEDTEATSTTDSSAVQVAGND